MDFRLEQQLPEDNDSDGSNSDFEDNYTDVLHSMSKKWLLAQETHKVSARATNKFWSLSLDYMPKLLKLQEQEGRQNPIPQFIQQRRKLHKQYCPEIQMEFGFQKMFDGSLKIIKTSSAPLKDLQLNRDYIKLYEIASIKVIITKICFFHF